MDYHIYDNIAISICLFIHCAHIKFKETPFSNEKYTPCNLGDLFISQASRVHEALAHLVEEVLQRPNFRGVDGKEVHDCREDVKATMDIVAWFCLEIIWMKNSFSEFFPWEVFKSREAFQAFEKRYDTHLEEIIVKLLFRWFGF